MVMRMVSGKIKMRYPRITRMDANEEHMKDDDSR
jgi:hypothetical protein